MGGACEGMSQPRRGLGLMDTGLLGKREIPIATDDACGRPKEEAGDSLENWEMESVSGTCRSDAKTFGECKGKPCGWRFRIHRLFPGDCTEAESSCSRRPVPTLPREGAQGCGP